MINLKLLQQLSNRYQTTLDNVTREYFQHLFLSLLYQEKKSEALFFKGGTALRLVWHSPRFSEDLDFTGFKLTFPQLESMMENVLLKIEGQKIKTQIEESKQTSGGYLAIFHFETAAYASDIQIEVSLRNTPEITGTVSIIHSDMVPPYTLIHLNEQELVGGKIQACLSRAKPRDFFDIYFLLRSNLFPTHLKKKLSLILKQLESKEIDFVKELKQFLPVNQYLIIKNFNQTLKRELIRYGNL